MIKTQIGLGVLSIPSVFDTLGLIPGIIILIVVGGITTWSNYIVGVFKVNHREIYGIDDVGELLFGRFGREFFGVAFTLCKNSPTPYPFRWSCIFRLCSDNLLVFTCCSGSAMLSVSIALNALSMHSICTAIFVAIAAIITFAFSSIRTLGRISWLAWIGAICIIIAGGSSSGSCCTITSNTLESLHGYNCRGNSRSTQRSPPARCMEVGLQAFQQAQFCRCRFSNLFPRFCLCRHTRVFLDCVGDA